MKPKHPAIGKRLLYRVQPDHRSPENAMRVLVKVVSVSRAFGRFDAVVVPVKGDGELRVQLESLEEA